MLCYLNIGSNLGDRRANLEAAIAAIERDFGTTARRSDVVESAPWGYASAHRFLNIGIAIEVDVEPLELLSRLQTIEKRLGSGAHRNADGSYADRLVDIDIMDIDGYSCDTERLTVPHRHLYDREFFLQPYNQLKSSQSNH